MQCLSEKYQSPGDKKEKDLIRHANKPGKSNINLNTYFIIDCNKIKRKKSIYKCIIMFSDTTCGVLYQSKDKTRIFFGQKDSWNL